MIAVGNLEGQPVGFFGGATRKRLSTSLGRPEDDSASIEQARESSLSESLQMVMAARRLLETESAQTPEAALRGRIGRFRRR